MRSSPGTDFSWFVLSDAKKMDQNRSAECAKKRHRCVWSRPVWDRAASSACSRVLQLRLPAVLGRDTAVCYSQMILGLIRLATVLLATRPGFVIIE